MIKHILEKNNDVRHFKTGRVLALARSDPTLRQESDHTVSRPDPTPTSGASRDRTPPCKPRHAAAPEPHPTGDATRRSLGVRSSSPRQPPKRPRFPRHPFRSSPRIKRSPPLRNPKKAPPGAKKKKKKKRTPPAPRVPPRRSAAPPALLASHSDGWPRAACACVERGGDGGTRWPPAAAAAQLALLGQ